MGIQVKTTRKQLKNPNKVGYWVKQIIPAELDALKFSNPFIFVFVSEDENNIPVPRFFIVPAEDMSRLCRENWITYREKSKHRYPISEIEKKAQPLGIFVEQLLPYENKWQLLKL